MAPSPVGILDGTVSCPRRAGGAGRRIPCLRNAPPDAARRRQRRHGHHRRESSRQRNRTMPDVAGECNGGTHWNDLPTTATAGGAKGIGGEGIVGNRAQRRREAKRDLPARMLETVTALSATQARSGDLPTPVRNAISTVPD